MQEVQPDDLILVAVLNQPRDLEIARVLGWYRIPVQTAPKTLQVDWIAFYFTAAFGDQRWAVRYLARVRGHELVRRDVLLRDEPQHPRAAEPYFKVQLGPVVQLSRPIHAGGWRRFTFLYTDGGRLTQAHQLSDLTIPSTTQRDQLWRLVE
jgi:hypothetical protein